MLPGNGKLLGELIFSGCRNLESISINSSIPPKFDCNSTLFEETERFMYERCVLYVPAKAIDAYSRLGLETVLDNQSYFAIQS